ncbi:phospholipase DDHD2 isoform X4 [Diorhabda sublineata]|uniref:phospholipase DDHD2 isoform X4 n=1 Tax=Diorhabda sublineata TaxID=1163346 RepID=UPI0024E0BE5F|nr:phospholipase DDHD2 isoform X4 [Diorhabda sublineata]
MNDPTKKMKNPLFNVSVTGGTFEDFSQNAILLPAKEKPPLPTLNLTPEQLLRELLPDSKSSEEVNNQPVEPISSEFTYSNPQPNVYSQNISEVRPSPNVNYSQELPDISTLQPHLNQNTNRTSSVFSSFSNILNIGGSNNKSKKEEVTVPAPAGIEELINQGTCNSEPVPLFSTNTSEFFQQKPPPTTGPVNVFRRPGLKRPAYAQIPGLSNDPVPPQNIPQNLPPPNLPPLPVSSNPIPQNYFVPSAPSPVNSVSSTSSIEPAIQNLPNYFKPISPPPPNLQASFNISEPLIPVPVQPAQFSVFSGSSHNIIQNTPVMDAIPTNEFSKKSHMEQTSSSKTVPTVGNGNSVNPVINHVYRPVYHHWFFQKEVEGKKNWQPFSMVDSLCLEQAFTSNDLDPDKVIATDGGRYDVNILRRQRHPVYWKGTPNEVRRCSWFHKNSTDGRLIPYEENISTMLEEEYRSAFETNNWHRTIELSRGESIVFHGPDVMVLFSPSQTPDSWSQTTNQSRPRVVKRGMDEFDIDDGEPAQVDHILFIVHGIGSVCDLKFRSVEEVVDEFRHIALQLVQSHYRSSCDQGKVNRVEVLPVSWYDRLHSEETGIDEQLKSITLKSLSKLRKFTNDTLLDILFYTSPVYCQTIVSTVGTELNRLYDLFKQRNPNFTGGVSLGGHSLGSLILFDLLCHQLPSSETECEDKEEILSSGPGTTKPAPLQRKMSKRISYMMGAIGTGQPQIHYPHLNFEPKNFFALGSPIGMFVIVRGLDTLGESFSLPTCPAFFNIFHPYDPIAYRIESLIKPEFANLKPVLIPHHKGRKRIHLELKETMVRVGADLKQKVIDSMRNTWNTFYQLATFHKQTPPSLEEEVSKVFNEQIEEKVELESDTILESTSTPIGNLNGGRRIDYVLQEAPFEIIDYVFALQSHVCYWESEDTILLMLKEIYSSMDITSDSQIPQQTMTIERPMHSSTSSKVVPKPSVSLQNNQQPTGMDPTTPITVNDPLRPPPTTGFVRKT